VIAQILKTIIYLIIHKRFIAERIIGGGGMPSSHTATVCGLLTAVGIKYGAGGFEFAISAIFAVIVMYDAMGVRRETGNQAKVINEMMEMFAKMDSSMTAEEKLQEFVGHSPPQVLIGAVLGIIIGVTVCNIMLF
jgi:acid phosphatase family membrane protein YuiD